MTSKSTLRIRTLIIVFGLFTLPQICFTQSADQKEIRKESHIYSDTLGMDIFYPVASSSEKRPVLIYVHGGGFGAGTRDHPSHLEFCEHFAKKGWVTATISYHLTMKGKSFSCDQPKANKVATFNTVAGNIHQSVAYLLQRQKQFNIDPHRIVLIGSSAGAEAALHAIYCEDTREGILPESFRYAGVISMAGALLDEKMITAENVVPTQMFHGTCDQLVPYASAPHHYCSPEDVGYLNLAGSFTLSERLKALNTGSYLVTDCSGGHEWSGHPIKPQYIHHIEDFLEKDVLNGEGRQIRHQYNTGRYECTLGEDYCK
ncbi:MAG: alpha/beta hydrolase [Cyclobacteriaceae bacterium]|nr:alpha/beta hydrolase [Cyclobacteriaceae bacterium]